QAIINKESGKAGIKIYFSCFPAFLISNGFITMLVFDAHLDLAWNAIDWNRDLLLPVAEIRRREREAGLKQKAPGEHPVSFPELRRGKVCTFIATLLARLMRPEAMPAIQRYTNMTSAYAAAYGQLYYYFSLVEQGVLRFIKDWPTLDAHINEWKQSAIGNRQ